MERQGFHNLTPFAAETLLLLDEEGAQGVTLVAKATYAIMDGALSLADEQPEVVKAPVYHGVPGASSLRYESEATFTKPATDVILLGHAQPEIGLAGEVMVSLSVGPIKKQVRVFGDRTWKRTLGLAAVSSPKPFERMPLVYERAFGGAGMPNPVGVGFQRDDMERDFEGVRLPNLESPDHLLARPTDLPPPAGFGYLAADWAPRRKLAGTFDEAWKTARSPRLPADFSLRHHNAAPPDQQVRGFLRGGEAVEVRGASHRGPLRFSIPTEHPEGRFLLRREQEQQLKMNLDTVIIDADQHQVSLIYRAFARIHRRVHDLRWTRCNLPVNPTAHHAHAR